MHRAAALAVRGKLAEAMLDQPNHRPLHSAPTPRIGGVGVLAGTLAAQNWQAPANAVCVLVDSRRGSAGSMIARGSGGAALAFPAGSGRVDVDLGAALGNFLPRARQTEPD